MAVILWLILISIAVLLHELAHYFATRLQGVTVKAFSVGMGPIIWRRQWRGTEWRISALPLGGYVDIDGISATSGPDGRLIAPTTGMAKLPYLGKVAILAAGPLINIVLALFLLTGIYWGQGIPNQVAIKEISPNSAAFKEGFLPGDAVISINGQKITSNAELSQNLITNGKRVFLVERNGKQLEKRFDWSPASNSTPRPKFGVTMEQKFKKIGPFDALTRSSTDLFTGVPKAISGFFKAVGNAFTLNKQEEGVVGVAGMIGAVSDSAQGGFLGIALFFVILNFSLGILNLLPIPALDGGRILIATIIAIRRKPLPPGREEMINFVGFAFLIAFMLLINLREIAGI